MISSQSEFNIRSVSSGSLRWSRSVSLPPPSSPPPATPRPATQSTQGRMIPMEKCVYFVRFLFVYVFISWGDLGCGEERLRGWVSLCRTSTNLMICVLFKNHPECVRSNEVKAGTAPDVHRLLRSRFVLRMVLENKSPKWLAVLEKEILLLGSFDETPINGNFLPQNLGVIELLQGSLRLFKCLVLH